MARQTSRTWTVLIFSSLPQSNWKGQYNKFLEGGQTVTETETERHRDRHRDRQTDRQQTDLHSLLQFSINSSNTQQRSYIKWSISSFPIYTDRHTYSQLPVYHQHYKPQPDLKQHNLTWIKDRINVTPTTTSVCLSVHDIPFNSWYLFFCFQLIFGYLCIRI